MTVKELAIFTGKTPRTIRSWISKAGENISQVPYEETSQGIAHNYSIKEVGVILSSGSMSKDAVNILMENAERKTNVIDYEVIGNMIGMAISAALAPVVQELRTIKQPLQITAPKEDYFSLVGYTSLNSIKTNRSELALHGRTLKKMAIEKGLTVKSIPDERWGKVNSYPVEILEEYFSA